MFLLTDQAVLLCGHRLGRVQIVPSQTFVTINGHAVLVESDPEQRPIKGCPPAPGFKPCLTTLRVHSGYSDLVGIRKRGGGRKRVCLKVVGLTDGTPPGSVRYTAVEPGQGFVTEGG